ncbi:MAG: DUF5063 domain-containing protein [Bacteroidota bacterium]|nr:DUF5063 domain-containing protein [Bacteroidota bacterium]
MDIDQLPDHIVYSQKVIEFVTVAAETCLFLEHADEISKTDFVEKSVKILPLLYLNASLVDIPEPVFDEIPERFVNEEDYQFVREQVEQLLGNDDTYLEVFHPDMALSDTPIAAFISENMADIYQELKDFAANYQLGDVDIMNDALVACLEAFREHWGQKLLNGLRAMHAVRFSDAFGTDKDADEPATKKSIDRNTFLNFQHDDDDELTNLL